MASGITVYINGDKLVCEPGSKLPPALKPEIRRCKSEIMALLGKPASNARSKEEMPAPSDGKNNVLGLPGLHSRRGAAMP
jgi:hypothetical protein